MIRKVLGLMFIIALACTTVSCGGGGGSSSEESLDITLSDGAVDVTLVAGDEIDIEVDGYLAHAGMEGAEVYLHFRNAAGLFAIPDPALTKPGMNFRLSLKTLQDLEPGDHLGSLEIMACRDVDCASAYDGVITSVDYALHVLTAPDWETHQGNASHDGYVPFWLDPSKFAEAWTWSRDPDSMDPIGGINAVVTSAGNVYVSTDVYFGTGILHALSERDGSEAWRQTPIGTDRTPAMNPPAVQGDQVFVATTGHEYTFLWTFDKLTGDFLFSSQFSGQWPHYLAPTVYGDQVYQGGGYYGGYTYCFSRTDGALEWSTPLGGGWDMYTPAVDARYAYHHNGGALFKVDRLTGAVVATIDDPFGTPASHAYHGAPMITGGGTSVISYSDGAFSGRASSNVEQRDQRLLASFDVVEDRHSWSSRNAYLTTPAAAEGVVYAARNSPMSLDALDEETGAILWSWVPTGSDTAFHRNIVVTRNLLFVSTDQNVYALDLATREPVWSYGQPGMLAISADRMLYIAVGARESTGDLVAISLN